MAFYLGDIPTGSFEIEPPDSVDLDGFDEVVAQLVPPTGAAVALSGEIDHSSGLVKVDPPETSPFTIEGVYRLRVQLVGTGAALTLPPVRLVAQDDDSGWHTLDTVREDWPDAEDIPDPLLWAVLELAREAVLEYGPTLAEDDPIPGRFREGQRVQARNIVTAARVQPDGSEGIGDFVVRPFPLDWHVKQIIRPTTGKPVVR